MRYVHNAHLKVNHKVRCPFRECNFEIGVYYSPFKAHKSKLHNAQNWKSFKPEIIGSSVRWWRWQWYWLWCSLSYYPNPPLRNNGCLLCFHQGFSLPPMHHSSSLQHSVWGQPFPRFWVLWILLCLSQRLKPRTTLPPLILTLQPNSSMEYTVSIPQRTCAQAHTHILSPFHYYASPINGATILF